MLREAKSDYRFEDVEVKTPVLVGEIKGAQGGTALVLAAKRKNAEDFEMNPAPGLELKPGDMIVALGSREQIASLKKKLGSA
jgi:Trk K+ transport system NAD-binding subunit